MAKKQNHEEALPRKERWYYKNKETGKAAYSLKEPLSNLLGAEELAAYEEITAEEWALLTQKPEPSAEQLAAQAAKKQIADAKAFLASTDWVVVKIAEETDPDEIAALREKYASVITERKAKRALINELEGE